MALINLISGALVTTGASLMLIGVIGLVLTRSEEGEASADAEGEATSSEPPAAAHLPLKGKAFGETNTRGGRP